MGQKVLILGESGTGKSASLRNFNADEILVINSAGKPLPFKNKFECVRPSYDNLTRDVLKAMDSTNKKVIVIDDAQYIMSFQYMRRLKEKGWEKWDDIQGDFFNIIKHVDDLPEDVIVYFLSHIQRDENGIEKMKTMGKMLDEKITLEGLFTTVLGSSVQDGQYFFITQNNGRNTIKSPIGMFPSYAIENDLKYIDTKIRNYYEIGEFIDDRTVEELDQEVKKEEIAKESADGGRRRRKRPEAEATTEKQETLAEPPQQSAADNAVAEEVKLTEDVKPTEEVTRRRRTRSSVSHADEGTGMIVGATAEEVKAEKQDVVEEAPRRRRRRATITRQDVQATEEVLVSDGEDIPF